MPHADLLLGIDIGTTDAKCTFYLPDGRPVAGRCQEYPMLHPREGYAEMDPAEWWRAVGENLRSCLGAQGIDPARVAAVAVSDTNTFFPVDEEGNALHNAILQLDQRTADEVEWIKERLGEDRILALTGNRVARGTFAAPTLRWFLRHRPELVRRARCFLVPGGYVVHKLTGQFTISESRMCFTLLGNIRTGRWDAELAGLLGLPMDKLPRVCAADEIAGRVSPQAAEYTGLLPGTPVVAGAMDTVAAAVGAGATRAGDAFLAVGTCGRLCCILDRPEFDPRLMNCRGAEAGQFLSIGATNAAGASLRWFRDVFGRAAAEPGQPVYAAMDRLAGQCQPGAGGLVYLPYLSGERCPVWDPDARGMFFGLSFRTGLPQFVRAVMEGVAYSLRESLEILRGRGFAPQQLTLGGGAANSRLWCQIFADVLGLPIQKLTVSETETLGGALLAGKAVGLVADPGAAARALGREGELFLPRAEAAARYRDGFALYRQLYAANRDNFSALARLGSQWEAASQSQCM